MIRINTCFISFLTLLIVSSLAIGQEQFNSVNSQQKPLALRAARMLDVKNGSIINNVTILIKNGRIVSTENSQAIPPETEIVDLGNVTLLPGLIDAHTHLLLNNNRAISEDQNLILSATEMSMAKRVLMGSMLAREMLEAGFTTVRDVGNSGINGDVDLRNAINAGWIIGPRIFASTRAISPIGGQFGRLPNDKQKIIDNEYIPITGTQEARQAVRQALYDGADLIKVIVLAYNVMSLEELTAIVDEAHRVGRKVAAHTVSDFDVRLAVSAGVDSIEHGYSLPDNVIKIMAEKKIFLVPTDHTAEYYLPPNIPPEKIKQWIDDRKKLLLADDRILRAFKMGVRIAAGSDSYYNIPGKTRGQQSLDTLRAYSEAGLPPIEIIRAATINAATLLAGDSAQFGSIEPRKFADIIAVDGNPLDDISQLEHVKFVMKAGMIIKR